MRENPFDNHAEANLAEGEELVQPEGEKTVMGRRRFMRIALGAAGTAMTAPFIPEAQAQSPDKQHNPFAVAPYHHPEVQFISELDAGSPGLGHPLAIVLNELPRLYYDHNVQNKIAKKVGKNYIIIPTPSVVFELSKLCWQRARNQAVAAGHRKVMLKRLERAAKPGVPEQKDMERAHDENKPVVDELEKYWKALEKETYAVVKKVMSVVMKERSAANAMKAKSAANSLVTDPKPYVKLEAKDPKMGRKHEKEFKNYEEIEGWLQPYPYSCDTVSESPDHPSEIMDVEAVKAFREYARWHYEAALHRRHRYEAIKAFVEITGSSARHLLKYDGTRHNDQIIKQWEALLRDTPDKKGKLGAIEELLKKFIAISELQSEKAEDIGRCQNRFEVEEIMEAEEDAAKKGKK